MIYINEVNLEKWFIFYFIFMRMIIFIFIIGCLFNLIIKNLVNLFEIINLFFGCLFCIKYNVND